jgi:hypothetical protein
MTKNTKHQRETSQINIAMIDVAVISIMKQKLANQLKVSNQLYLIMNLWNSFKSR